MMLSLTGATLLLLMVAGVVLLLYMRHQLLFSFDQSLLSKAQALRSLLHVDASGKVDFDFADEAMPEFNPGSSSEYFQLWSASGECIERSPSLGSSDLFLTKPLLARRLSDDLHTFIDIPLPDYRPGRAVVMSFYPSNEENEDHPVAAKGGAKVVLLAVARDRHALDHTLATITGAVLVAILALAAATAWLTPWLIVRNLRPLDVIADQARAIGPGALGHRFTLQGMPDELVPICTRLNDSLEKLQAAFDRERRFSADVAHELRTPIAELRLLSELAVKFPPDPSSAEKSSRDAQAIAGQMESIVVALLELNQPGSEIHPPLSPVLLSSVVDAGWSPFSSNRHNIALRCEDLSDIHVLTRADILERLFANLFDNAVEYGIPGTGIHLGIALQTGHVRLSLTNQTTPLDPEELSHLSEPFSRKDPARTGNRHAGLGLSLVESYARRLKIVVKYSLPRSSLFQVMLEIPAASEAIPSTGHPREADS
jgi:two-component system sensor histidine kinase QseC